jgi:beta-fructofuranosidase
MIVPRELTIRDGKLYQNPVKELEGARTTQAPADGTLPRACDMVVKAPEGAFDLNLFTKADGSDGFTIHYDEAKQALVMDKSKLDERFNDEVGEVLEVPVPGGVRNVRVLIDSCSVELYINGGEKTFSAHVYPHEGEHHYTVTPGAEMQIWNIAPTVVDDFVV